MLDNNDTPVTFNSPFTSSSTVDIGFTIGGMFIHELDMGITTTATLHLTGNSEWDAGGFGDCNF